MVDCLGCFVKQFGKNLGYFLIQHLVALNPAKFIFARMAE